VNDKMTGSVYDKAEMGPITSKEWAYRQGRRLCTLLSDNNNAPVAAVTMDCLFSSKLTAASFGPQSPSPFLPPTTRMPDAGK